MPKIRLTGLACINLAVHVHVHRSASKFDLLNLCQSIYLPDRGLPIHIVYYLNFPSPSKLLTYSDAAAPSGLVELSVSHLKQSETFANAIHATIARKRHVQNSVQVGEGGLIL